MRSNLCKMDNASACENFLGSVVWNFKRQGFDAQMIWMEVLSNRNRRVDATQQRKGFKRRT